MDHRCYTSESYEESSRGFSVIRVSVGMQLMCVQHKHTLSKLFRYSLYSVDVHVIIFFVMYPWSFFACREINGITLCYKVGNFSNSNRVIIPKPGAKSVTPQLAYSLHPKDPPTNGSSNLSAVPVLPKRAPAEKPPSHQNGYQNVVLNQEDDDSPHEYEKLVVAPLSPKRPAPQPPLPSRPAPKLPSAMSTYATLGNYQGINFFDFGLTTYMTTYCISYFLKH